MKRFSIVLAVLLSAWPQCGCAGSEESPDSAAATTSPASRPSELAVAPPAGTSLVRPENLVYRGAFRLPEGSGSSSWEWSGYAITYCPEGDPGGERDGYPGSLFAVGHDHQQMVSEISIPRPVISTQKRVDDLNVATTLQPFRDIRNDLFGELEIPRAGLAYLPSERDGQPGKLYFCWGQHFQFELDPSHGRCDLNLERPAAEGLWRIGNYTNYVTNDYMCDIPEAWSRQNLPGFRLATGRFRDGEWGGLGPALLAIQPPAEDESLPNGAAIEQVRTLLMYGKPQAGAAELDVTDRDQMSGYSAADEWSGVSWLSAGERAAVVFVGTKGEGKTWYGFANGVEYPTSGDPNDPVPDVPPFPFDARGWWSAGISAQMLFYNPADLAAVAAGTMPSWEPQPYAHLLLDGYLFDPGFDHPRQKRYLLGACCFDRERGLMYIVERRADESDKSLIHVFSIGGSNHD